MFLLHVAVFWNVACLPVLLLADLFMQSSRGIKALRGGRLLKIDDLAVVSFKYRRCVFPVCYSFANNLLVPCTIFAHCSPSRRMPIHECPPNCQTHYGVRHDSIMEPVFDDFLPQDSF